MALGEPIKLRLNPEKHAQYEEAAACRGQPLSTYLREWLERDDINGIRDELAGLRRDLASLRYAVTEREEPATSRPGARDMGLLLEILMLLRVIGGPDRTKMVSYEMRRLGYDSVNIGETQRP